MLGGKREGAPHEVSGEVKAQTTQGPIGEEGHWDFC